MWVYELNLRSKSGDELNCARRMWMLSSWCKSAPQFSPVWNMPAMACSRCSLIITIAYWLLFCIDKFHLTAFIVHTSVHVFADSTLVVSEDLNTWSMYKRFCHNMCFTTLYVCLCIVCMRMCLTQILTTFRFLTTFRSMCLTQMSLKVKFSRIRSSKLV